ncbi:hypothetical protein FHG87_018787 [Trinorchestia longiramus]|nr:hypothetical protein FHG87_018787 [Trinorchestia longiramus]
MPLDTSRRLLLGGRYSQLPTLLEDDQQPPACHQNLRLQQQSKIFDSRHDLSRIDEPSSPPVEVGEPEVQPVNGHHGSINGCHESRSNGTISSPSHSPKYSSPHVAGKAIKSSTCSSLVYTDGAVVPQVQPHQLHTPFISQMKSFPSHEPLVNTEVHLSSRGRPFVRPGRPCRANSPSSLRSAVNRPCTKQLKSSPPPVRPPRYKRSGSGRALLRAVTSRGGRAYRYQNLDDGFKEGEALSIPEEDSDSTEEAATGNPETSLSSDTQNTSIDSSSSGIHSVGSSPRSSPPYTPPPRSPHPGILVSNSSTRQGFKRLAR